RDGKATRQCTHVNFSSSLQGKIKYQVCEILDCPIRLPPQITMEFIISATLPLARTNPAEPGNAFVRLVLRIGLEGCEKQRQDGVNSTNDHNALQLFGQLIDAMRGFVLAKYRIAYNAVKVPT